MYNINVPFVIGSCQNLKIGAYVKANFIVYSWQEEIKKNRRYQYDKEMRRSEKAMTREESMEVLEKAEYGVLSTI
ncbi:hypothetical protein P0G10_20875, partial [Eubacteriales bacterium DFI.9.88]|nr:hypothetical protein [Eubacteriales bacterium DFI.9.88]